MFIKKRKCVHFESLKKGGNSDEFIEFYDRALKPCEQTNISCFPLPLHSLNDEVVDVRLCLPLDKGVAELRFRRHVANNGDVLAINSLLAVALRHSLEVEVGTCVIVLLIPF